MIVKVKMNPSIIDERCDDYLRDNFTYSDTKIISLEYFQIYTNYLLKFAYRRSKKIAVQRLLERLGLVIDCYMRSRKYDCKN